MWVSDSMQMRVFVVFVVVILYDFRVMDVCMLVYVGVVAVAR